MKLIILSIHLFFIIKSVLAQENNINNISKIKRDSASGESKYINSWIGKEESYDCCEYYNDYYDELNFRFYSHIDCENNHIIRM